MGDYYFPTVNQLMVLAGPKNHPLFEMATPYRTLGFQTTLFFFQKIDLHVLGTTVTITFLKSMEIDPIPQW